MIMRMQRMAILASGSVVIASISVLFHTPEALAEDKDLSRSNLQTNLEKAVMCDTDAINIFNGSKFVGGSNDPKPQLENLGVRIIDDSTVSGPSKITYRFPPNTIVFGHEASEALYYEFSTEIFFISLRSSADRLSGINKRLRLNPIPKGNPDGYGLFDEIEVRYIRKLSAMGDMPPDTIFSGTGTRQNYIVIGCQNLAW